MKRFESLESLRGIAALCVVLFHVGFATPFTDNPFVRNSHLMVDFFFVLSGFVIFHSYARRLRGIDQLVTFVVTRFGRVYPLHLAMLLVFLGFETLKYVAEHHTSAVPATPAFSVNSAAAFVSNLALVQALGLHGEETFNYPSWSISTEFFTYLLFGFVFHLGSRNVPKTARFVSPILALLAFGTLYLVAGSLTRTVDFGLLRCIGGFFLGVSAYQAYLGLHESRLSEGRLIEAAVIFSALGILFLMSSPLSNEERFLLPPLFATLVVSTACLATDSPLNRLLSTRPLLWIGERSYSIYMLHAGFLWITVQVLRFGIGVPIDFVGGRRIFLQTDPTTGSVALLLSLVAIIAASNWTFREIEDRYRTRSRTWALRIAGRVVRHGSARSADH